MRGSCEADLMWRIAHDVDPLQVSAVSVIAHVHHAHLDLQLPGGVSVRVETRTGKILGQ